ncbi:hypothetical protein BB8028_0003g10620 [Beauveria bassiana]|uniref:Zn(2)-C6 fungal-type domain-containing protein n=1 Tax=Beauveria bassiana TaxID=176275 RepID=A0A2S7Y8H7_BEABA|nr:hypothetical protein BB8028_0003g10620 [Beauveria bassiana]
MIDPMDQQQAKRIRLACLNCRRKKARCPGERPVCSFCSRLSQDCRYDDEALFNNDAVFDVPSSMPNIPDSLMADNLISPEPQPSVLHDQEDSFSSLLNPSPSLSRDTPGILDIQFPFTPSFGPASVTFDRIPNGEIVQSLIDTYFQSCHCQPYCYFQESSFRRRLSGNTIPEWLLFSVLASAVIFSDNSFFQDRQAEAVNCYASCAWKKINARIFEEDDFVTVQVVQAICMLAVIDFAAGSYTQAWVKIGLSIRLAQALDLLSEPDPSLLWWAKEERRRTFWSVYLLDRIVTSSPGRSPSILDADCTLSLPVDQATLAPGMAGAERITVMRLLQHPRELGKVGYSGFLCLLASTLGRVQRYCLRRSVSEESLLPWDSQSEFASIYSVLLTCEAYSPTAIADFEAVLEAESSKMAGELNHNSILGIFCFSHALYFLSNCLLQHPFLIRHRLKSANSPIPPSFLRTILPACRESASRLTGLLQSLQKRRLCLASSLGYCALIAGAVHRIFEHDQDLSIRESSQRLYKSTLDFLLNAPVRWQHFPRLARALQEFNPDPAATSSMISPFVLTNLPGHPDTDAMWKLLDYGKASQNVTALASTSGQGLSFTI